MLYLPVVPRASCLVTRAIRIWSERNEMRTLVTIVTMYDHNEIQNWCRRTKAVVAPCSMLHAPYIICTLVLRRSMISAHLSSLVTKNELVTGTTINVRR